MGSVTKSKRYKGVRDFSVSAKLLGEVIEVTVTFIGVTTWTYLFPLAELPEHPYDLNRYLQGKIVKDFSSVTWLRLVDEARKAISEIRPSAALW